jgi:glycosyltransferase involved in cell wall biosynthesis
MRTHRFDPSPECPELSVVVPLFNESENLDELYRRLSGSMGGLGRSFELIFVDDGSRDQTPSRLDRLHRSDPHVGVVHLSRNFGHQPAVSAGIEHARGRAVLVMDGDLQDPPEVLPLFVAKWEEGNDVVYAVRRRRKEGPLKRAGYHLFYRLLNAISELDIPLHSGDFCLMDRKVVDVLVALPESARFVRGLRTFVGFRQVGLDYERAARAGGESKYTLRRLIGLAADGLVSFSSYPLRLVTRLGVLAAVTSVALLVWVLADALGNQSAPRGWASTMVVVLFMGSLQLLSLGIVGEYVRLIFTESKRRPTYIVGGFLRPRDARIEARPADRPLPADVTRR